MERPLLDNVITAGVKAPASPTSLSLRALGGCPRSPSIRGSRLSEALEAAELSRVSSASESPSAANGNWGGEPRDPQPTSRKVEA